MDCKTKTKRLIEHSYFKVFIILANFIVLLFVADTNEKMIQGVKGIKLDMVLIAIVSAVCLFETIAMFYCYSFGFVFKNRVMTLLELILLSMTVVSYVSMSMWTFASVRFGMRNFEMILVLRCLRVSTLLKEIKMFSIVYEFCFKMAKPMLVMFSALYFCFYCFAVIGNMLVGGLVTTESA